MNKWNDGVVFDDEGEAEHVEFDELQLAPLSEIEPAPEPAAEPETIEQAEVEVPLTSADGDELIAPEGYVFAIYTGSADSARLGEIKMKPGAPTLVSKEQSLTLLTHPFESFVISDRVFIEAADKE